MQFRYHEWTTRAANKAKFTAAENLLYSACVIALNTVVLGSFWLLFCWPSPISFGILMVVCAAAWRVMSQTPSG